MLSLKGCSVIRMMSDVGFAKKWTANGKEVAAFLGVTNSRWSRKALEETLQTYLDLTTGEVVCRLNKYWRLTSRRMVIAMHMS